MISRKKFPSAIIIFILINCCGCYKMANTHSESALGTICTVTLYDRGSSRNYKMIFDRIKETENLMSANIRGSEVDMINRAAGLAPVKVSDETFEVMEKALYYAQISEGAFDPTVGPLVRLWDIGAENPAVPSRDEIDKTLPLINWREVELDRQNKTVYLKKPGMAIDLGGIAKGYAADQAAAVVRALGIPRSIIDLGGNILITGAKNDNSPWRVGIQDPLDSRGSYIGIVNVYEKTVVTSGVYQRYFYSDGIRYHHIFEPSTGYPVRGDLLSVTVITDSSVDADALSTAIFVMGYERGMALIKSFEGVDGVFIFEDKSVGITGNVDFTITDNSYFLIKNQE